MSVTFIPGTVLKHSRKGGPVDELNIGHIIDDTVHYSLFKGAYF